MTTPVTEAISEADQYLKEVTPFLADLAPDERSDLLEDLALHLREVEAEPGPPLVERLGPPSAYAAELLASAGVSASVGAKAPARPPLWATVTSLAARLRRSAAGREVARLWPSLRPAWWVARGYLAVLLLTELSGNGSFADFPFPRLVGNALVGLVAIVVAVSASVRLGPRKLTGLGRAAVVAANGFLLFFGLSLAGQAGGTEVYYVDSGAERFPVDACLRNGNGSIITNLYGYDASGTLLDPVLLYDQFGLPIDNLCPEFDSRGQRLATEYRRDANGAPVINAFPRKQSVSPGGLPAARPVGPESGVPRTTLPATTVPVTPPAVVVPRLSATTTVP